MAESIPGHLACQISGWYIYFLQTYSPKIVFVDDLIFQTVILSIFRHRTEIKMTVLESWYQTGSETCIFYSKISIWEFDLFDPGLTWPFPVVDWHGVRLLNGFDFWILRSKKTINHVLHARKNWFWWPFVTWPWPWPVLRMALMLTGYLH